MLCATFVREESDIVEEVVPLASYARAHEILGIVLAVWVVFDPKTLL